MDRKTYRRYLKTKRWQKLRFEVLKRSKGKCERCGYEPWKPNGLQVHHASEEDSRLQDYLARLEKQINEYDGENWIEKYAE